MYNKVILIGNTGNDPEVKTFENGNVASRINVATQESYKDKEGNWQNLTEWHRVVIWKKLPDAIKKGSMVFVEGSVKTRKYTDKDGTEKTVTEIAAQIVRSLTKSEKQVIEQESIAPQISVLPAGIDEDLPF